MGAVSQQIILIVEGWNFFYFQTTVYETILLFYNYLPFKKGYTHYFKNLDSPSHKNALYQYCTWDFFKLSTSEPKGEFFI